MPGSGTRSQGGRERSGLIWFVSHDVRLDFLLRMVINIFRKNLSKNSGDQQVSLDSSLVGIQSITAI